MSTPSTTRLPWILVTLLVAVNVIVLTLVWFRPPPCAPHPGGGHMGPPPGRGGLAGEIGMNEAEAQGLFALQDAHFERMENYHLEIVALRKEAFAQFGKPEADTAVAMAAFDKIGSVQIAAEKERYKHFHEVLALCNPTQAAKFQEILPRILERKRQPEDGPMPPQFHGGLPPR